MFYTFNQNNSGGYFKGPETVIVEAENANHANELAKTLGLYFDHEYALDCECCGRRWYEVREDDGTQRPEVYGTPAEEYVGVRGKRDVLIRYANGDEVRLVPEARLTNTAEMEEDDA